MHSSACSSSTRSPVCFEIIFHLKSELTPFSPLKTPKSTGKHTWTKSRSISLVNGTTSISWAVRVPWSTQLHIYRALHYITNSGTDIRLAQYLFIGLYLATLALVLSCYRTAGAPPWVLPLLVLSKRLHSIFMLRLFNDGFAVFFLFAAVFCYQRKWWTVGSLAFSLGLGVKMSLLLALPAVGVVLWQGAGRDRAVKQALLMGQVQVSLTYQQMDESEVLRFLLIN
jgi:hypothetical protein